jgi:hypothetical protein
VDGVSGQRFHLCIDVNGVLLPLFTYMGERPITYDEARAFLQDELAKGHEVIPFGKCDSFDYKEGCPGHELTPEQAAKVAEYEPVGEGMA